MSRFEMVQCDACLEGCAGEELFDEADSWVFDGWVFDNVGDACPSCADKLALEGEFELGGDRVDGA